MVRTTLRDSIGKLIEVLGSEETEKIIEYIVSTSYEETIDKKDISYLRLRSNKSFETHKIIMLLNHYHKYLLFTEEYIATQLDQINEEHRNHRKSKDQESTVDLKFFSFKAEQKRLQTYFPNILRTSLFIALCSFLEDVIKNGINSHKSNHKFKKLEEKGNVESAKIILIKEIKIKDIEKLKWDYFINLFRIRNDLVHNGGKINNSRKVDLEAYKISKDENEYLVLSKEALDFIFKESIEFIEQFSSLVIMDL